MKKQAKKRISLVMALALFITAFGTLSVNAEQTDNTVHVTVVNTTFTSGSAPWVGQLLEADVTLQDNDSMESVIERAITEQNYEFTVSQYGYISSINGLSEYAANGNGGWMASLNDWFTADGTAAYTVANGGLQAGDEINMQYTCSWGADVGSLYGDYNTSLKGVDVKGSVTEETYNDLMSLDGETFEYTLGISVPEAVLSFYPEAYNKNYQVRTYLNSYQPTVDGAEIRRGRSVSVKDGDIVYIGVGEAAWPSMNSWGGTAEKTVYTFRISYVPVKGDLNGNGILDIQDVTILQRALADFESLNETQTAVADFNNDKKININDATDMQRKMAELPA